MSNCSQNHATNHQHRLRRRLSRTDIRQQPRNHQTPLLPRGIRVGPVLQPAVGVVGRQGGRHVGDEVRRDALVAAVVDVVHGAGLQAVVVRVRDDADDVVPRVVRAAVGLEVPRVAHNGDGLELLAEVRAVQGQEADGGQHDA